MADNDKLSFSWELKGTVEKQINEAAKSHLEKVNFGTNNHIGLKLDRAFQGFECFL